MPTPLEMNKAMKKLSNTAIYHVSEEIICSLVANRNPVDKAKHSKKITGLVILVFPRNLIMPPFSS
jgi:hypothetical protein